MSPRGKGGEPGKTPVLPRGREANTKKGIPVVRRKEQVKKKKSKARRDPWQTIREKRTSERREKPVCGRRVHHPFGCSGKRTHSSEK